MNKNLLALYIFIIVVFIILGIFQIEKVEAIGDFFGKILDPVGIPISLMIATKYGLVKYKEFNNKD